MKDAITFIMLMMLGSGAFMLGTIGILALFGDITSWYEFVLIIMLIVGVWAAVLWIGEKVVRSFSA